METGLTRPDLQAATDTLPRSRGLVERPTRRRFENANSIHLAAKCSHSNGLVYT